MVWWSKTLLVLSAIGAINWGFAQFDWNLVDKLVGSWSPMTATIVYWVVALCGIYALVAAFKE